ncbi:MAG: tetratricopeptide repeat protein [Tannerellaceae bacterium]|nr:tetratricopeptide repeat protein [Tannerellaceae bacterium]
MLIAGSAAAFAQKAERSAIREGNKLYADGKFTESEIAFRKSIEVNPRSVEGTFNLGNALYKEGKFPEAAEQYQLVLGQAERLLQDNPDNAQKIAQVFHNIGNISMNQKEYAKSIDAYKRSLRLNPHSDETRYNLALAQKLLDNQQDQQDQQNQDDNKEQQQQQQQQQQKENDQQKSQEQQQQNEQMSKDNAQQILDAFLQDEKDTQEKVKKAQQMKQDSQRGKKW